MNQINWKGLGEEFGLIIVRGCNKCVEISQWISRTVCVNNWKWFLTNGSPYWSMLIVWFAAPNWKMWNNCASVKSVPVKGAVSLIKRKFVIDDSVRRMKKEGKSKREKERKRKKERKKKDGTFDDMINQCGEGWDYQTRPIKCAWVDFKEHAYPQEKVDTFDKNRFQEYHSQLILWWNQIKW